MFIEPKNGIDDQIDTPLRKFGDNIHCSGGGVFHIVPPGFVDHIHDLLVVAVHGFLVIIGQKRQAFLRFVVELFFNHKGDREILALVDLMVADKPVHSGAKNKGFGNRGAYYMEERVFVLRTPCILLFQVGVQRGQIHFNIDVSFVVRPVWHNTGHDAVQRRQILQPDGIGTVSPFSFSFHKKPP